MSKLSFEVEVLFFLRLIDTLFVILDTFFLLALIKNLNKKKVNNFCYLFFETLDKNTISNI